MDLIKELCERSYDPLTEEEWLEMLTKYNDSFKVNYNRMDNNNTQRLTKGWNSTVKEHFTLEEWTDIVNRFDRIDDEDDEEESFDIEMYEEYYSQNTNPASMEHSKNKGGSQRSRNRLSRRGGRSKRR